MRNIAMEAAIWYMFTSIEYFEAAANECEDTMNWFGGLAVARSVPDFGRNNQIYDKFKSLAKKFRQGAEFAILGDYRNIRSVAGSVRGDIRGMIEQPLHSWMTEAEYHEFEFVRLGILGTYSRNIELALHNAIYGADIFFDPTPDNPERVDDDDGMPGEDIMRWYKDYTRLSNRASSCKLPDPLPEYIVDKSVTCKTGDEVPWTGVWYPATGLERYSLTFAIKGMRMQPVYHVIKTTEELRTPERMFPRPQTVAVATVWHPVIATSRKVESTQELWAKAGDVCPKTGLWQPTDPGAQTRNYNAGDKMLSLGSAQGLTVWRWLADR